MTPDMPIFVPPPGSPPPEASAGPSEPRAEEDAPTVQAPPPPVLEPEMLDELREIAGDEALSIVNLFLEDAPRLIRLMEQASAMPDLEVMREAAHALKSSSANVGALALSAAAKRIELGARAQARQALVGGLWLAAAGLMLGAGVWAMHFIALVALETPLMRGFAAAPTIASCVIALAFGSTGFVLGGRHWRSWRYAAAGLWFAVGLA